VWPSYDAFDRRVKADGALPDGGSGTVESVYIWCGHQICKSLAAGDANKEYYAEGETSSGTPVSRWFYGVDQVGSIRRAYGSTASAFDYDPWGQRTSDESETVDFGYHNQFSPAWSPLNLTLYRTYDPLVGRWLSRDPIGEIGDSQFNLYTFVGNAPSNHIDPHGLDLADDILEWLGPGSLCVPSPKGAFQLMSADRSKLIRFDITPGTSHGLRPHINIEPGRIHIYTID
jgi:RHS repeat-associated protein